jgi:hypothetical protein
MYRGERRWIFCLEAAGDDDHLAFYGNRRIIEIASPFSLFRALDLKRIFARESRFWRASLTVDATSIIFWIVTAKKMQ